VTLDGELAAVRDFLADHPPFDALPVEMLADLPGRLTSNRHPRGTVVLAAGAVPTALLVVRSGAVELRTPGGDLVERGGPGTCLGGEALAAGVTQPVVTTALEDTEVLVMPAAVFGELCEQQESFATFFSPRSGGRLRRAVELQREQQGTSSDRAVLRTRAGDLVARQPVRVPPTATIRDAAARMTEQRVSSVLVTDDDRLVGILTGRDLRSRVVARAVDPFAPVSTVMTSDPITTRPDAMALEVLLELVRHNIHHLPLVEDDRVVGVISANDLLRLEQANPVHLVSEVAKAPDVTSVAGVASRLGRLVQSLVRQGTSAHDICRVVSTVADAFEQRLLQLAEAELGSPPVAYAWVTLGSRARYEQALGPDQDHALVLDDGFRPDDSEHQAYFAELAERVTAGLEQLGYPRCPGDKMATNPSWRQPVASWRNHVSRWVRNPSSEAILESSVFFDLRHQYGDSDLTRRLAQHLREAGQGSPVFLAHLATHVVSQPPPLGFFRGLVVDRTGEHRSTLDLKRGGLSVIVQIARVHGLAAGSEQTSTPGRLADAVAAGLVSSELASDLRDAWEFLAHLRLRHQAEQVQAGEQADSKINPSLLSSFDRRHLKDSFGVIRSAQAALAQRYPVHVLS
jgi:CBS domain-containing protein